AELVDEEVRHTDTRGPGRGEREGRVRGVRRPVGVLAARDGADRLLGLVLDAACAGAHVAVGAVDRVLVGRREVGRCRAIAAARAAVARAPVAAATAAVLVAGRRAGEFDVGD